MLDFVQTMSAMTLRSVSATYSHLLAVNYDVGGDKTTELIEYGSNLKPPAITIDGWYFEGWYYDEDFTQSVKDTDKVTSNQTIYAKLTTVEPVDPTFWQKIQPFVIAAGIVVGCAGVIVGVLVLVKKRKKKA